MSLRDGCCDGCSMDVLPQDRAVDASLGLLCAQCADSVRRTVRARYENYLREAQERRRGDRRSSAGHCLPDPR